MLNPRKSNVLIIASMHRSGSSLTAALLQSAGVHIGRELLSPNVGNIKGHYENLDFYHLHMAILESQGINSAGWTLQEKIDVEDRFVEKAKEIIKKNSLSEIWGWKEPRTTLFLEFWAELLPEAKFIFVYRYPWEVIDSLYRRGDPIFQSQPDMGIKIWLHYNRNILNFYNRFPERCHLASLNNIISTSDKYIESVNQRLQINLIYSGANIYEPSLLQQQSSDSYRPSLVAHYFPEAIKMYQELEARAWQPQGEPDFSWLEKINANPYRISAFQDWVSVRSLERQNQDSQNKVDAAELVNSQTQLQQVQTELQQTKLELDECRTQKDETEAKLEQSQSQLHQTQVELKQSQSQLHQTQGELEQSQSQLHQTQEVLEQSQSQLHQNQEVLEQSQSQLHQTQEVLEQSQSQLHQNQGELEQSKLQLHQNQGELEQSKLQLHQTQRELKREQSQLHQTQEELEQSQSQLHQTQEVLEQSQSHLHQTQEVLEQSQSHLHQTQEELEQSQSQLHQTQEVLEQSQSHLHQTQGELEQSQSQLHQTQGELEQSQSQLHQTQEVLEQSQSQLHQTQGELERSQFQQTVASDIDGQSQMQYKLLEWEAWYAYHNGDLTKMRECLQQSLKYTPLSPTETVLKWLESFTRFSSEKGYAFDSHSLTASEDWKQLMRRVLGVKVALYKSRA